MCVVFVIQASKLQDYIIEALETAATTKNPEPGLLVEIATDVSVSLVKAREATANMRRVQKARAKKRTKGDETEVSDAKDAEPQKSSPPQTPIKKEPEETPDKKEPEETASPISAAKPSLTPDAKTPPEQPATTNKWKPKEVHMPIAEWDFGKRLARYWCDGEPFESENTFALKPEMNGGSPVGANFEIKGHSLVCRVAMVWFGAIHAKESEKQGVFRPILPKGTRKKKAHAKLRSTRHRRGCQPTHVLIGSSRGLHTLGGQPIDVRITLTLCLICNSAFIAGFHNPEAPARNIGIVVVVLSVVCNLEVDPRTDRQRPDKIAKAKRDLAFNRCKISSYHFERSPPQGSVHHADRHMQARPLCNPHSASWQPSLHSNHHSTRYTNVVACAQADATESVGLECEVAMAGEEKAGAESPSKKAKTSEANC